MNTKFSLKILFALVTALAVGLGLLIQWSYRDAKIEITENHLAQNSERVISGDLHCRCHLSDGDAMTNFICRIEGAHQLNLKRLVVGDQFRFRYRAVPLLNWFEKEDPYTIFLTSQLGFEESEIVGQIILADQSVVILRQRR